MSKILIFTHPPLSISSNVAVIGSSSILLDNEYGSEINNFTDVVRFNRAPTEGFGKHVGDFTTIRCVNPHVFASKEFKDQDQYFIRKQTNCKIVVIGPENRELKFENHVGKIDKTCTAHKVDISGAYMGFRSQPTVGMCFVSLLVRMGIKPTLYGFHGMPEKEGKDGLTHYWHERENKSVCHSYQSERDIMRNLENQNLIEWIK